MKLIKKLNMILEENMKVQSTQDMIDQIDDDYMFPNQSQKKEIFSSLNSTIKETQESEVRNLNEIKNKEKMKIKEQNFEKDMDKNFSINTQTTTVTNIPLNFKNEETEIETRCEEYKEEKSDKEDKELDIITTNIVQNENKEKDNKDKDSSKDKNKEILTRENMHNVKEFKLYYHNVDLYMIKMAKYCEEQIIFLCYELKLEKDPNFFYYNIYTRENLIKLSPVFLLIQKRDKLFKTFSNIFNNNNVKLSKDVCDKNKIKLSVKLTMPDGEETNIFLELRRKDRKGNEAFYDHYISYARQQKREKEREQKKITESWGENDTTIINYEVGINFETQIDDGTLRRA